MRTQLIELMILSESEWQKRNDQNKMNGGKEKNNVIQYIDLLNVCLEYGIDRPISFTFLRAFHKSPLTSQPNCDKVDCGRQTVIADELPSQELLLAR